MRSGGRAMLAGCAVVALALRGEAQAPFHGVGPLRAGDAELRQVIARYASLHGVQLELVDTASARTPPVQVTATIDGHVRIERPSGDTVVSDGHTAWSTNITTVTTCDAASNAIPAPLLAILSGSSVPLSGYAVRVSDVGSPAREWVFMLDLSPRQHPPSHFMLTVDVATRQVRGMIDNRTNLYILRETGTSKPNVSFDPPAGIPIVRAPGWWGPC